MSNADKFIDLLIQKGIAKISDGAVIIETEKGVLMLRKSDGASTYGYRDLIHLIDMILTNYHEKDCNRT